MQGTRRKVPCPPARPGGMLHGNDMDRPGRSNGAGSRSSRERTPVTTARWEGVRPGVLRRRAQEAAETGM